MKKYLLLVLICLFVLTGCQATPEKPIVIKKEELVIEETSPEINRMLEIPNVFEQNEIEFGDNLSVSIDATIYKPEGQIPVARLTNKLYSDSELNHWVQYITNGTTPYYQRDISDYSKDELEKMIIELKSGIGSDLYNQDPEAYWIEIKDYVKELEKLYVKASEEGYIEYYDKSNPDFSKILEWDGGKRKPAYLLINDGCNFFYANVDNRVPSGLVTDVNADPVGGVSISKTQAEKTAIEFVQGLGLIDFEIDAEGLIPYPDITNDLPLEYDNRPKCYIFYFTKKVKGLREVYVSPVYSNLYGDAYNNIWQPEFIEVTVADCGVVSAYYQNSPANISLIEENVKIMDFKEIINRFNSSIKQNACYIDQDENIIKRKVYINEIRLGGTRIIEKDTDNYLLIPTWNFFGTITEVWKDGTGDESNLNENNEYTEKEFRQCILTINAIDGSIIDRNAGY